MGSSLPSAQYSSRDNKTRGIQCWELVLSESERSRGWKEGFEYFINRCRGKMQSEDYLIESNAANCAERAANSQIEEERRGCSRGFPGYRLFWATAVACCHSVPILNKRPTRKVIERYQHSSAIEAGSQP